MVLRGQIQGFVYKGFPEIRSGQGQRNFEACAAQAVVIGVVHVENQVHRPAGHPDAGEVDFLQRDIRLCEAEHIA